MRIKLDRGSAEVKPGIKPETVESLNNMVNAAYEMVSKENELLKAAELIKSGNASVTRKGEIVDKDSPDASVRIKPKELRE